MGNHIRTGILGAVVLAAGLASTGCVSVEQHHAALADLQRLRVEAWQKGVEAAALRMALDRAVAENAQLRAPLPQTETHQAMAALAARLDEVARRQETIADEVRASVKCAPGGAVVPASGTQTVQQPQGRKVTDLLYSRF